MVGERGYVGCDSHFRHLIAELRPRPPAEGYQRLRTLPGEQAQVDWALRRSRHRAHYAESPKMPSSLGMLRAHRSEVVDNRRERLGIVPAPTGSSGMPRAHHPACRLTASIPVAPSWRAPAASIPDPAPGRRGSSRSIHGRATWRLRSCRRQLAIGSSLRCASTDAGRLAWYAARRSSALPSRFFRTICGRFAVVLCLRDELPTASVGRFVASADRPPPWTTLHCRRRRTRGRRSLCQSDGSALADSCKKRFNFRQVVSSESCSDSVMRGHMSGPPSPWVSCRRASLTCFLASSSSS